MLPIGQLTKSTIVILATYAMIAVAHNLLDYSVTKIQ